MLKLIAPICLLFVALFAMLGTAGATSASLSVTPANQTVDDGDAFTVGIMQNSGAPTTGAETDISFDSSLLQVSSVQAGAGYTGGALLMGVAPQTPAQAIAEANTTGTLKNVSVFFLPGLGSAPAGEAEFVALNMQAKAGIGGVSPVTLSGSEMLDEQGSPISVSVTNGQVTVNGPTPTPGPSTPTPTPTPTPTLTPEPTADTPTPTGTGSTTPTPTGASATPSSESQTPTQTPDGPTPTPTATPDVTPTPTPTATPSPTPSPSPTLPAGTRTPVPGGGTLLVSPSTQTVPPGSTFSVTIKQNSSMVTTGVQASFSFDPLLLQIVSVERGRPYQRASLIYGLVPEGQAPRTGPIAIADANASGTLLNITTFFLPPGSGSIQPGEADFVKFTLQARDNNGSSHLTLSGSSAAPMSVLDESGEEFGAQAVNGEVVVQTGAPAPLGASRNPSSLPNSGGPAGEDNASVSMWLLFVAGLSFGGGATVLANRRIAGR